MKDYFIHQRLQKRETEHALRKLTVGSSGIDFSSNDYLGVVRNRLLKSINPELRSGSTGSRLLTGNSQKIEDLEAFIARFHRAPAGLIFGSGFEANTGLISTVAARGDTIFYDSFSHASIRDGIRLSNAQAYSFLHNDASDLSRKLKLASGNTFVLIESVYSMDGDMPPLADIVQLCNDAGALLIVDEAHATGVLGNNGEGLVQDMSLEQECFARVHTFGKACGAMGAIVLGSSHLKEFLVNFSRPFIYTTGPSEVFVDLIFQSYQTFPSMVTERTKLHDLIAYFNGLDIPYPTVKSETAIQAIVIEGNDRVRKMASMLQQQGLDVRPILYPSVQKGSERLRVVLHSFNEISELNDMEKILNHSL